MKTYQVNYAVDSFSLDPRSQPKEVILQMSATCAAEIERAIRRDHYYLRHLIIRPMK